jgi:hypothetical protein
MANEGDWLKDSWVGVGSQSIFEIGKLCDSLLPVFSAKALPRSFCSMVFLCDTASFLEGEEGKRFWTLPTECLSGTLMREKQQANWLSTLFLNQSK